MASTLLSPHAILFSPRLSTSSSVSKQQPPPPCSHHNTTLHHFSRLSISSSTRPSRAPSPLFATEGSDSVLVETTEEEQQQGEEGELEKPPARKPIVKLGDIMGILHKRAIEASDSERPVPDIRTGDVVEIKLEVPENRRRASIYKGIVISKQNAGIHTTIRIRRIIAGLGVEIVFPVYSPNVKEIKVVSHRKVRRAKLYYLREKLPRFSTFK